MGAWNEEEWSYLLTLEQGGESMDREIFNNIGEGYGIWITHFKLQKTEVCEIFIPMCNFNMEWVKFVYIKFGNERK